MNRALPPGDSGIGNGAPCRPFRCGGTVPGASGLVGGNATDPTGIGTAERLAQVVPQLGRLCARRGGAPTLLASWGWRHSSLEDDPVSRAKRDLRSDYALSPESAGLMASLKPRMPCAKDLPSSGNFLGPNINSATARINRRCLGWSKSSIIELPYNSIKHRRKATARGRTGDAQRIAPFARQVAHVRARRTGWPHWPTSPTGRHKRKKPAAAEAGRA